jgi:hypothetical protein
MKLIEGVIDFGTAEEFHVDGVSGIYRVSEHTICVELYANKIVDGKVQKVVVLRNTWDRSCWIATQETLGRLFGTVAAMPNTPAEDNGVHVH